MTARTDATIRRRAFVRSFMERAFRTAVLAASGALLALTTGCATMSTVGETSDPLESVNRPVFRFNDALDKAILQPVAEGYVRVTPQPVRTAVSNFFDNVGYLNVVLNDLLQGKVEQGFGDIGRFLLNSTIGVLGLFDVATELGLTRHEEDFGQTLGVWGAGEGAYLILPVLGPSSVRDAPGLAVSAVTNLIFYVGEWAVAVPLGILGAIDARARVAGAFEFIDQAALERYSFIREAYRQRRNFLIHDGSPPPHDILEESERDTVEPAR
jgi:phospholipid-binding lipoprotein MlaA